MHVQNKAVSQERNDKKLQVKSSSGSILAEAQINQDCPKKNRANQKANEQGKGGSTAAGPSLVEQSMPHIPKTKDCAPTMGHHVPKVIDVSNMVMTRASIEKLKLM